VVVDGDEHRHLPSAGHPIELRSSWALPSSALAGPGRRHVGAPHGIDRLGNDRAVMVARPPGRAGARGRQQSVLAHQTQHTVTRRAKPGEAQARPHLAVALAMEGTGVEGIVTLSQYNPFLKQLWLRSRSVNALNLLAPADDTRALLTSNNR